MLDWKQLLVMNREQGIYINERTAGTLWRGEHMDYGLAIEVLLQQAKRRRNVSAERAPADRGAGHLGTVISRAAILKKTLAMPRETRLQLA